MLECEHGMTVHLFTVSTRGEERLSAGDPLLERLEELGYEGPPPRTAAEAEERIYQEEFRRMPPTTQQRRLIELICLYGNLRLEDFDRQFPNRWEAGCWIKAHIAAAGDWPYFDG